LDTNFWSLEVLRGLPHAVTAVAGVHTSSVLNAFFVIIMFLVLRVLLRKTWAAVAAVSVLLVVVFNPATGSPWSYLISFLIVLPFYWVVLFRSGLLAIMTGTSLSFLLLRLPLTFDLTAWYAEVTLLVVLVVLGVATWGFWAALAGRPIFRDEIAETGAAAGSEVA
jgi:hypothetical protein